MDDKNAEEAVSNENADAPSDPIVPPLFIDDERLFEMCGGSR